MGPTKLSMGGINMVMALFGEGLNNRKIGRSEAVVCRVKKAAAALRTGSTPER